MDVYKMSLTDLITLKSLIEKKLDRLRKMRDGERGYDYDRYNKLDLEFQRNENHKRLKIVNERIEEIVNF